MTASDISSALSNSLSLGSILILTALGLAITFGVMRVINMAHGEMLMLGAYVAVVVTDARFFGSNLFVAIPASFLVVAFIGYLLEVSLIRFLYGRPLDTLLATWGVGIVIKQAVNLYFGARPEPMHLPDALQGGWNVGEHLHLDSLREVQIPYYRLFIVGITLLCLLAVYVWFYKTSFGLKIRAVVQNRPMAAALGISTRRIDSLTFAFASGLAGLAGCILAHLYSVNYTMGENYIVDAFMVVTLGGMGNMAGSVGSGAMIGTGNSVVEKVLGNTPMAKATVLLAVVAFLLARPSGLFATKERSYE
jgi:urea transport system permease protein